MIIVINGVPTTCLWRKNEEKRPILSEISENKNSEKFDILFTFIFSFFFKNFASYSVLDGVFGMPSSIRKYDINVSTRITISMKILLKLNFLI